MITQTQNTINRVALADSYKYSHAKQYPEMVSMYDYMESRGGVYPATFFVGLQYYLKKYFSAPIEQWEVDKSYRMAKNHGTLFDKKGWDYIVNELGGKLPVKIKAVKEGSLIPTKMVLITIESTDKKVAWVAGWLETILMKVWYPTTIATKSYYVKQMLEKYGSPEWAQFAYHNFGDRGSSSVESAAIGGFAHISSGFMGTDNFNSLFLAEDYYNQPEDAASAYSVFATEHSTTTAHGKENEIEFVISQLIENPDLPIMSFVADSYDVFNFTDECTKQGSTIRDIIEGRETQTFVLRPDSGDPFDVIPKMLDIMIGNSIKFSRDENNKILFKDFRILWGDGITPETIEEILKMVIKFGYSAENFVFGSGGDLMQNLNRDTQKFAIKCSSISIDEGSPIETGISIDGKAEMEWDEFIVDRDVFKDPITDPGKTSKKGKVTTYYNRTTESYYVDIVGNSSLGCPEVLEVVYENGVLQKDYSIKDIKENLSF